ncbi:hypothetical protein KR018_004518, partial [Drosophila ironensis]
LISRLAGAFKNAMLEKDFSDCRVVIGSRVFHCHKVILGIASDFFKRTFLFDFKEAATSELVLNTIEPETFEKFLLFVYTYDKKLLASYSNNTIIQLIECATMWFVPQLLNACTDLAITRMDTMTLADLLRYFEYGHQVHNEKLISSSVAKIKLRILQVMECQNVYELGSDTFKEFVICMKDVLQSINLYKLVEKYVSMMGFKVNQEAFKLSFNGIESDTSESKIVEPKEDETIVFQFGDKNRQDTIHGEYVRQLYDLIDFSKMTVNQFHEGPGQDTFLTFEEKYKWLYQISSKLDSPALRPAFGN